MVGIADWKYWKLAGIVLSVLGLATPVLIWYAESKPHSIKATLVSVTALQPQSVDSTLGLKVVVGDVELKDPYLAVLELRSDGSKPIEPEQFKAPLDIRISDGARIVRANVTSTIPADLGAEVVTDAQTAKLAPLLLNPGDSVTMSIVTAGKEPQFAIRSRIAGISSVAIVSHAANKKSVRTYIGLTLGTLGFSVYLIAVMGLIVPSLRPTRRTTLFIMISSGLMGGMSMIFFLDAKGLESLPEVLKWSIVPVFAGSALAVAVNWPTIREAIAERGPRKRGRKRIGRGIRS